MKRAQWTINQKILKLARHQNAPSHQHCSAQHASRWVFPTEASFARKNVSKRSGQSTNSIIDQVTHQSWASVPNSILEKMFLEVNKFEKFKFTVRITTFCENESECTRDLSDPAKCQQKIMFLIIFRHLTMQKLEFRMKKCQQRKVIWLMRILLSR